MENVNVLPPEFKNKPFYTTQDIAKLFDVNENTVRVWIKLNKIKGFKIGRMFRVTKEEFERIIKEGVY